MKPKKVKDIKYTGLVLKLTSIIKQLQAYLYDVEIAKIIALGFSKERKEIIEDENI